MRIHLKVGLMGLTIGIVCSTFATELPQDSLLVVQEQRIEIIIRNSEFLLIQRGGLQFGYPTVTILRNQNRVRQGFTSSWVDVSGEASDDVITFIVVYPMYGTVVAWVGQHAVDKGIESIKTHWIHATNLPDDQEKEWM